MNYENFLSKNRAILDAPAGYGKTYSIVECLKTGSGKKLILTHTHAGVASLKNKIKKAKIDKSKYRIETIDSFVLRIFKSYTNKTEQLILNQEPNDVWKNEGRRIKQLVAKLLNKSTPIKAVLSSTYTGVFVDEYQDCSKTTNQIVNSLSEIFPVYIFVDWMQAIFNFNKEDPLVTLDGLHEEFKKNIFTLDTPWRWKNANKALGEDLKKIRQDLLDERKTDLSKYDTLQFVASENELYKLCFESLKEHENESILIVHPNKKTCRLIAKKLGYSFHVLESIDDKDFYRVAKIFDNLMTSYSTPLLFIALESIFLKSNLSVFYKNDRYVKKTKEKDVIISGKIQELVRVIEHSSTMVAVKDLISYMHKSGFNLKDNRIELFRYLLRALERSVSNEISVQKAMRELRDSLRHQGRSPYARSIDTTLLTKGLEFDVVVVTDANNIGQGYGKYSMENWYVAVSRAMKRLIIHSASKTFNFQQN